MICPDCKEKKGIFTTPQIDNIKRCSGCDDKMREKNEMPVGRLQEIIDTKTVSVAEFKPYKLTNGPLKKLEGKEPSLNLDKWSVQVESKRQENDIMREMDCHFGENGENALGFEIGKTKPIHPEDCGFVVKE